MSILKLLSGAHRNPVGGFTYNNHSMLFRLVIRTSYKDNTLVEQY